MGIFSRSMKDVVTAAPPDGADDYGHPEPGEQVEIKARVERNVPVRRSADGKTTEQKDVIATHGRLADGSGFVDIDEGWFFWMPGADKEDTSAARQSTDVTSAKPLTGGQTMYEVRL